MSNDTKNEGLKVNEKVKDLAESIKKDFKIGDGGVIALDKGFYANTLPEGLTIGQVEAVQKHNSNLLAATALALGDLGIPHLKKHKDLASVSVEFGIGKDKLAATLKREQQVPDGLGKGGMRTKYGVISANYKAHAAGNVGDFKRVREHVANEAASAWGK